MCSSETCSVPEVDPHLTHAQFSSGPISLWTLLKASAATNFFSASLIP